MASSASTSLVPDYAALSKDVRSRAALPSDYTDASIKKMADYICAKPDTAAALEFLQSTKDLLGSELTDAIAAGAYTYVCPGKSDIYNEYLSRS
jgi:hypothetical protein